MAKYTTAALREQIDETQKKIHKEINRTFYASFFIGALSVFMPPLLKRADWLLDRMVVRTKPLDDKVTRLNSLLNARTQAIVAYQDYKKGLCSHETALSHVIWYKRLKADPSIKGPIKISSAILEILGKTKEEKSRT